MTTGPWGWTKGRWGAQAGIAIGFASIRPVQVSFGKGEPYYFADGSPAVKLHDNTVVVPRGPALQVLGIGPMTITDNELTSQGALPMPKRSAAANDKTRATPLFPYLLGGAVQVVNFGLPEIAALWLYQFEQMLAASLSGATVALDAQGTPRSVDLHQRVSFDGSVIFNDNRVNFNLAKPEDEAAVASVLVASLDDVTFHANQLEVVAPMSDAVVANAAVAALWGVRTTGNAFMETPGHCSYSLMSLAAMNTATDNQGTHCFYVAGVNATVNENNLAPFCRLDPSHLKAALAKLAVKEGTAADEIPAKAQKAAKAYHGLVTSLDTHRPAVLGGFQAIQVDKVDRLRLEKDRLRKEPGTAARKVEVDTELAASEALRAGLGDLSQAKVKPGKK